MKNSEKEKKKLVTRPPIVVVLGHVNHGKTTLLDYIRKTKVAEKEAGSITQHIGAYEIEFQGQKITFIDTPGHEAFSKIRSRGAKAADIAILVIAADESVKPQTLESWEHIKQAGIPFIIALTKIDKPEANPEKVKKDLADKGILVEGWGGDVPWVKVSAKTGEGIEDLLEMILLVAEMEELRADIKKPASGIVIESHLDPRRGHTASLIIQEGTLRRGDKIKAGKVTGKVKILEDFSGRPISEATVSAPVRVIGFTALPQVGEQFFCGEFSSDVSSGERSKDFSQEIGDSKSSLIIPTIIKVDVYSSLEALLTIMESLAKEKKCLFKIIRGKVGDLSEEDLKLRAPHNTLVVLFRVKKKPETKNILLRNPDIIIVEGEVIYELQDKIEEVIEKYFVSPVLEKVRGKLEVIALFNPIKGQQLVGGKVLQGSVAVKNKVKIIRADKEIGEGKIVNLQSQKVDVKEVKEGQECGVLLESPVKIEQGDFIVAVERQK